MGRKFRIADSPKDALFRDHFESVKRFPLEANAVAQENALSALQAYLECSDASFGKHLRPELVPVVAERGLSAAKVGTRQKSLEVLMLFVEVDGGERVVTDLIPFFTHKQPKLVAGSLSAINEILKYIKIM